MNSDKNGAVKKAVSKNFIVFVVDTAFRTITHCSPDMRSHVCTQPKIISLLRNLVKQCFAAYIVYSYR